MPNDRAHEDSVHIFIGWVEEGAFGLISSESQRDPCPKGTGLRGGPIGENGGVWGGGGAPPKAKFWAPHPKVGSSRGTCFDVSSESPHGRSEHCMWSTFCRNWQEVLPAKAGDAAPALSARPDPAVTCSYGHFPVFPVTRSAADLPSLSRPRARAHSLRTCPHLLVAVSRHCVAGLIRADAGGLPSVHTHSTCRRRREEQMYSKQAMYW